jgi:competence protein ComEC
MDLIRARRKMIVLGLLLLSSVLVWAEPQLDTSGLEATVSRDSPYLEVHFLDVGQGDAIFIETPDGVQVLIDGGPDGSVIHELSSVMNFFDRTIDLVIGTHPDKDHIGGLVDVLERYTVANILTTDALGETEVARLYQDLIQHEGATVTYATRGQRIALGASTTLEILSPEGSVSLVESNTASIVARLVYGERSFLFTGDAPKSIEEYLVLTEGEFLKSDVLKVGHHGSRTSTSELFLAEVQPELAVVSAGKGNQYGHPHVEVTDALFNAGVEILSTSEVGTISILSDGERVWVK